MMRSFLLALALLTATATFAADPMFDAGGTLARRVALETGVSDACAAATLAVQDEFAKDEQIAAVNAACAKDIAAKVKAVAYIEMGADGHVCIPTLGNGSGFLDMKNPGDGIFDYVQGICTNEG